MANYAGLDIGLESTAVCVMDQEGTILHEAMVPSDPDSLSQYLKKTGLSFKRVGMEACPLSQWLFDGLVKDGFPTICIEIRHLKAAMSAMTHKLGIIGLNLICLHDHPVRVDDSKISLFDISDDPM